jgi:hypothetical protein
MKKYQILVSGMIAFAVIMAGHLTVRAAEVVFVQGSVQVQSAQDSAWRAVEKGMQVNIGDMIRTARNSAAEITLDAEKKNTVRIEQKTQVILNSATADTMDRLDLAKGKVYANLEGIKSGLTFEVNTPSAVAGVRGSALSVYVERDSDEVTALKDTVFIKAFDADKQMISETTLPEGFKTFIERFDEPSAFMEVSTREFRNFDNKMEDLSNNLEGKMGARLKAEEERKEVAKEQAQAAKEEAKSSAESNLDQAIAQQDLTQEFVADTKEAIEDQKTIQTIEEMMHDPGSEYWTYEQWMEYAYTLEGEALCNFCSNNTDFSEDPVCSPCM